MWDLSFPTRNQTHAPCLGSMEPQPLGHQGGPPSEFWGHWPVVFWQPGSLLRRPVSSFPIFCRSLKGLLFVSVLSIHDGDWQESCFPPLCWALAWSASSLGKPLFFSSSGRPFYIISLILPLFHFLSALFWCSGGQMLDPTFYTLISYLAFHVSNDFFIFTL